MTKNQIIEKLYTGKNFTDCIAKMEPEHLREDLKQEVILIVCEWDEEKIQKLHADHVLEFYVVRVILNLIKSNTSNFYKTYRQIMVEFINHEVADDFNREERELREMVEDMAIEEIDRLYWYEKGLIELYIKHGNYRAIEKDTGIPFTSCYKSIQKSIKTIREKVAI